MNPPPHAESLPPRPASHRWVIGFLGFMTFGVALVLLRAFLDKSLGEFQQLRLLFASIIGIIVAFLSICIGGRRRWVYWVNSVMLVFFVVRISQLVYLLASFRLSHLPEEISFSFWDMLFYLVAAFLITLLAWRFILGRPSRRYFGFGGDAKPS